MAKTASVDPLFVSSVISVIHALNAASFAVEPNALITQSIMTIIATVKPIALDCSILNNFMVFSTEMAANIITVTPHIM